ncbi:MAG: tyrosine--tRNA ligase [Candidatus Delongbacteria bacterium]|nr:tyrosine--tRNA ligase [Candidatus Delongbacteria bacterium]
MLAAKEQLEILKRGIVDLVTEEELLKKLERSVRENKPLIIKQGFDPTAPDLHIGHTVSIRKLRQFQELGHQVVFLIGDFTGMIGDPSGKSKTRKQLTADEVRKNAETYKKQIFKILDPEKTIIDFNSRWCAKMTFEDVLILSSKYTVARMLERDDFYNRYKNGIPISIIEFLYPMVQGYDSVSLKADVEIGGTDQTFNLLIGRDIQREYGLEPQVIMTVPILEGLDGKEKMSKSLHNYIGINESPDQIFGKVMSIPDHLICRYFELATNLPMPEVKKIEKMITEGQNPSIFKRQLGKAIVALYHDREVADKAEAEFDKIFVSKDLPDEMPLIHYQAEIFPAKLITVLKENQLVASNGEAKRLIEQNAVEVNRERVTDINHVLNGMDKEYIIKCGKRKFLKIIQD